MFHILKALMITAFVGATISVNAQAVTDPTSWTYEVKQKSGDLYEVVFHLKLNKGWHIWSINPGGDGTQIAPSFTFDKKEGMTLDGETMEIGKKITEHMDGVEGDVNYYSDKVDYTQLLAITSKVKLTGKHEYQVCNDKMCLPPKTLKFTINVNK